jgi:hypothetical protein
VSDVMKDEVLMEVVQWELPIGIEFEFDVSLIVVVNVRPVVRIDPFE